MISLGEKIKKRRKQLKLTLKELAGDDFSYSLLSQIENNKAKPSMATLHKLADKLSLPINELINPIEVDRYRNLLVEFEKLIVMPYERNPEIDKKIVKAIEPILENIQFNSFEEARIVELYVIAYFYLHNELKLELLRHSITYYEQIGLINKKIQAQLFICKSYINQQSYNECEVIMQEILQQIEGGEYVFEPTALIDSYYYKAIIEAALGNYTLASSYTNKCLELMKQASLYYKIDAIYRLQLLLYIQLNNTFEGQANLQRLYNYTQFTRNTYDFIYYSYSKFHFENRIQLNEGLSEEIQQFIKEFSQQQDISLSILYNQELAYTLWKKGLYAEALQQVKEYEIPPYVIHPLERAAGYEILAIRADCYYHLGNEEQAFEDIVYSKQHVKPMPNSTYKNLIYHIYDAIFKKS
ncbi:helix-turn-helix domain-containing protein [Metasolibacillus meyeri]|uniref:helix-turn-helix domain-containing protein n=1 Tax=Metasolibacillus meyeri TaxID=1071052 RepID=UPI000D3218A8|nr:helix-turn-helix transcriptional regulator [Metasolibacillus meyeri]